MNARSAACAGWLLLWLMPGAGCRQEQSDTQVMIEIDAEHAIRARIHDVEFEVKSGQGPLESWTPRYAQSLTRGGGAPSWPLEVALVPRAGQTERNYVASATARDVNGHAIAQVRVISGYIDGKSLRLPLLFDGACLQRTDLCSAELTCRAGDCVDARVDPATLLPFASERPPPVSGGDAGTMPVEQDASGADAAMAAPGDAGGGAIGATCEPGTPGCAPVMAVPVERCPDARCAGCPDGFVKDDAEVCVPLLAALGVSRGALAPSLNALDTRYALDLGLLDHALVITPLAADGVRIEVDGTQVRSGEQYRLEALPLGRRTLSIALSMPGGGARTYTIELARSGAQRAYLKAGTPRAGDRFGYSLAFDGETIVVGAPDQDSGSGTGAVMESGGAHVFTREGDGFGLPHALAARMPRAQAFFGTAVAVDGDTLAVGAPGDSGGGAVYVYVRDEAGSWSEQARLPHPTPTQNLEFGSALVLRGDTLIVGAPGDDRDRVEAGAVFFFTRDGTLWSAGSRLAPNAPQSAAWFGSSLALDGDRLAVGATGETTSSFTSGAAYVFERSGGGFVQRARVVASNPGIADFFGESVGLVGDTLVVGGFSASTSQGRSGAIYVYERDSVGERWPQVQQVSASNPSADAQFGMRLAFAGDLLLTGASQEDSGGTGVGSDGSGPGRADSGAGYVFVRRNGRFEQLALLKADNADPGDAYGIAVAMHGNTIVIGADAEASASDDPADNSRARAGAVYVVR